MKKILFLSIVLIFCFKCNTYAAQIYDYYQGVDLWLGNNQYYSANGGSFDPNTVPNAPLNGVRKLPNQGNANGWENFVDIGRYWAWNSNAMVRYDNVRWNTPNYLEYYLRDNGGNYWYDNGVPNKYCGYYYIFYRRPKPCFIYTNVTGANYYKDVAGSYWIKPNNSINITSKWFDNEGRMDLGKVYLRFTNGVNDEVYHQFYSSNVNVVSFDNNVKFMPSGDSDCDSNGYGANFKFSISKNNADMQVSTSGQNSQGTCYHRGNVNSENWGSAGDQEWVNNFMIKTDGDAPDYGRTYIENITSSGFDVCIDNVRDSRSGVKSVQFLDSGVYKNTENIGNGLYRYHYNLNSDSDTYSIKVKLTDNVGNSRDVEVPTAKPTATFLAQDSILQNQELDISDTSNSNDPKDIVNSNKQFQLSGDNGSTWNDLNLQQQTTGIQYSSHISNIGWTDYTNDGTVTGNFDDGDTYHFEALKLNLSNNQVNGMGIKYRAHCANIGWQDWVSDGAEAGTTGQNSNMQALNIELTNAPQGFHVYYQAYVQGLGWKDWVSDGQQAGTTGEGRAIIGLRVKVVNLNYKLVPYSLDPGSYQVREKVQNLDSKRWSYYYIRNLLVKSLIPINASLEVQQYDYKENDNNYWVRPNSVFGVYTNGYFPQSYGIYPSRTYVLFAQDGNMIANSGREYADLTGHYSYGVDYMNHFNFLNNGDKAVQSSLDGNNYLSDVHQLSAKNDGDKFELYYTNSCITNKEYSATYQNSKKWIKVDGKAPTGVISYGVNGETVNICGADMTDNDGSGIKEVDSIVTDPDTGKSMKVNLHKKDDLDNWETGSFDAYALAQGDKVNIKTYATDNVGNTALLEDKTIDFLTIKATLTPSSAKQGQQVIFTINTTGYAKYLYIYPPEDITSQDKVNTFPLYKEIKEEPIHEEKINYIIPLTVPQTYTTDGRRRQPYTIRIDAKKSNGRTVTTNVQLDICDNVLSGIKTEIIDTGQDVNK